MNQQAIDFLIGLNRCHTLEEQTALMSRELAELGFGKFIYAMVPMHPYQVVADYLTVNTLDPDWMDAYMSEELFKADYALEHAFRSVEPLKWSQMYTKMEQGQITGDFARSMQIARDFGVSKGVTVPFQMFGGVYKPGISIVADKDCRYKEVDENYSENEDTLLSMAEAFHYAVNKKEIGEEHYQLTVREHDVLKWMTMGLAEKEIAHHTGRSLSTIEKQARSMRFRMKAATSQNAVAKAVSLEMI